MIDTLLLSPSLHFTTLHPTTLHSTSLHYTQLHFTPLHYTCRHFSSSHLNFTRPHFTTLSFGLTASSTYIYKPEDKPIGWKHVLILVGKHFIFFLIKQLFCVVFCVIQLTEHAVWLETETLLELLKQTLNTKMGLDSSHSVQHVMLIIIIIIIIKNLLLVSAVDRHHPEVTHNLRNLLLLLFLTAIKLSLGGSSPYTSTDKTNKNKYT